MSLQGSQCSDFTTEDELDEEDEIPEEAPVARVMPTAIFAFRGSSKDTVHWERRAPKALHTGFDPKEVCPWDPERFQPIRKLQDARRNFGQVNLMRDRQQDRLVAVKKMPNRWVCKSHEAFLAQHPGETERPWQDLGCTRWLNEKACPFACEVLGVYRDEKHTYVVSAFAAEGDLLTWCQSGVKPGTEREVLLQPVAKQILEGVRRLHDLSIAHRDLSPENVLLSRDEGGRLTVWIIDYAMASTTRLTRDRTRGKAAYTAPEQHRDEEYDAFQADAFAVGVMLYALLTQDYPWLSTRPGGCQCFEYLREHGFRSFLAKRKLRGLGPVEERMSEPLKRLLEGLLALDPEKRLTLGESAWQGASGPRRRSVWDEPWVHDGPGLWST